MARVVGRAVLVVGEVNVDAFIMPIAQAVVLIEAGWFVFRFAVYAMKGGSPS